MERDFEMSLDFAKEKDKQDSLASVRDRFYIQPGTIYMDGNSLGLASKDAREVLMEVFDLWQTEGINIWNIKNNKYFLYQDFLGERMAQLINARGEEVTVMTNTTINIHQGISTFYHPTKDRYKILVDDINFPTDRYAIDSQVKLKGYDPAEAVKVVKSQDGLISEEAVIDGMTDDVAIVFLPSVYYRSAQLLDMKRLTEAAHQRGIIIGFDLCHSIGVVDHNFAEIQPDFAVWCTYKYLNAGPGSIAGFYINQKHFALEPGLAGWQGNRKETQFLLKQTYEHVHNAGGWQTGTQPLLSMAPIEGALKVFEEVGMVNIREKSLDITAYLMYLIDNKLAEHGFSVGNPREAERRGGHVCLVHQEAYRITAALKDMGVVPDFREPNVVRLAPIALYTSYEEVYQVVEILKEIALNKKYENYSTERGLVV